MIALIAAFPLAVRAAQVFTLSSSAFMAGQTIPSKYTCASPSVNPPLAFGAAPSGTKSFAILGWDEGAPGGLASTWVVYDIPATATGLAEAASGAGFEQGRNTAGKLGYSGPCPLKGGKPHRIYFDLYAIDALSLGLPAGASLAQVHAAIKRHRLLEAKLMGIASR